MQRLIEESLEAMVVSQEQMSRSLQSQKHIVSRLSKLLLRVDSGQLTRMPGDAYTEAELSVGREISSYVHALADFEHALVDHVKFALKELRIAEEE